MHRIRRLLPSKKRCGLRLWREETATQVVEFALSLPLLVVFVVGIFDFSNAITLKQKLINAAREGARVAAADPASDLSSSGGMPVSVNDAWQVVDNYLLGAKVNDCGLSNPTWAQTNLTWTATASGSGCPGAGITLTISRGCTTPQTQGPTMDEVDTCVKLQYPYKWEFNNVSSLVGGTFSGPATITTTATSFNEN
ncbi:MAG TPA: TadE family protein [Candidatus Aquilonibacter sp.]|nr:TadE family protein [Candidatus Aquilonibacter sp.]